MRNSIAEQMKELLVDQDGQSDKSIELLDIINEQGPTMKVLMNTDNQAEVVSLSKNRTSLERNERISFPANGNEDNIVKKIMANPSTNKEEILIRQQLFSFLLSDNVDLEKIIEGKRGSGHFSRDLDELWGVDSDEKRDASRENRRARRRITVLKQEGKLSLENIARVKKIRAEKRELTNEEYYKYIGNTNDLLFVLDLRKTLDEIPLFIKNLSCLDNSIIKNLNSQLQKAYNDIHFPSVEYFIQLYLDDNEKEIDKLFAQIGEIDEIIHQLGALFAIARKLKEDGYAKVTLDEDQPISFKQAWQFNRKKIIEERDKPNRLQVLNDSMEDVYCDTLVGDIMSGKSFQGELNQQLHICAQSIGYAPASQANVHIFHRFISIDRALTDSGKGLSAFGEDITNILEGMTLADKTGKTFLFLDEWGSTTSPEDQALLLKALLTYMIEKDIKIVLATHNEEFVKYIQDNSDFEVYHLKTALNEDGTVDFQHTLEKGVGESHILEAAQTLGLSDNIHDIATRYMEGDIVKAKIPEINVPKLKKYSLEEREKMKKESGSLISLMPYGDEIKIIYKKERDREDHQKVREIPILKYRYSLDHYDREDGSHRNRESRYKPETKPDYNELMTIISGDNDFSWFHASGLKTKGNYKDIGSFVRRTASKTPEEIFEIQKLFEELQKIDIEKLRTTMHGLGNFLFYIATSLYTIREKAEGFNIYLLDGVYSEVKRQSMRDRNFMHAFNIFLAVVKLNNILLGDEAGDLISSLLEALEKIKIIDEKIDKMNKESHVIHGKIRELKQEGKKKEKEGGEPQSEREIRQEQMMDLGKEDKIIFEKQEKLTADIMKLIDYKPENKKKTMMNIMDIVYQEMSKKLYEYTKEKAKPVNLFDIDINILGDLLLEEEEAILGYDFLFDDSIRFVSAIHSLLKEESSFTKFTDKLREIDSVYTHQFANYMDNVLSIMFPDIESGNDIMKIIEKSYKENIGKEDYKRSRIPFRFGMASMEKIKKDIFSFQTIIDISILIKENNLCKVDFNDSGEINMKKPYNPIEKPEDQIKNNFHFGKNNRAVIKTGANMSGKTKSLKQSIWPMAFANSIGYAPAESMTTPIVSQLLWIDRIKARQDLNLSAGGTEVLVRKEIFEKISSNNGVKVGFFDEMWSTIPPSYQTPMTYATVVSLIEKGLYIDISHHNHQFIDDFINNHPEIAEAVHFKTNIQEDGTVTFDYLLEKGHTKSQALLVAKTLGMLQEVLDIAEDIKR